MLLNCIVQKLLYRNSVGYCTQRIFCPNDRNKRKVQLNFNMKLYLTLLFFIILLKKEPFCKQCRSKIRISIVGWMSQLLSNIQLVDFIRVIGLYLINFPTTWCDQFYYIRGMNHLYGQWQINQQFYNCFKNSATPGYTHYFKMFDNHLSLNLLNE